MENGNYTLKPHEMVDILIRESFLIPSYNFYERIVFDKEKIRFSYTGPDEDIEKRLVDVLNIPVKNPYTAKDWTIVLGYSLGSNSLYWLLESNVYGREGQCLIEKFLESEEIQK